MNSSQTNADECPTLATLQSLVDGVLGDDATVVNQHVTRCVACERVLEAINLMAGPLAETRKLETKNSGLAGQARQSQHTDGPRFSPESSRDFSNDFGEYEILGEIARGGMGVVHKARHRKLGRVAAVKLIRAGNLAGDEEIKRFQAEAAAASQLDHPNIVPVFEAGEHAGQHFMAMAFVEGPSLWNRVKDAPLEPMEAARVTDQVARAVHFGHEKGIVHRDLKPQNILMTADGVPKVTDFGLAKRTHGDAGLTGSGVPLGTPGYMPPEQVRGDSETVGPLADVYSLGATLYALLTSRPPFQGTSPTAIYLQVLRDEPVSPRVLNPGIPRDLETICLKAMQKDPGKRYASAAALADDLARFTRNEPIVARPVGQLERAWRWGQRNKGLAAALLGVVVSLTAGTLISTALSIRASQLATQAQEGETKATLAGKEKEKEAKKAKAAEAKQKEAADQATADRNRANEKRAEAERNLYLARVSAADAKIKDGDYLLAREILNSIDTSPVEWELAYLRRAVEATPFTFRQNARRMARVFPRFELAAFSPDGESVLCKHFADDPVLWRLGDQTLAAIPTKWSLFSQGESQFRFHPTLPRIAVDSTILDTETLTRTFPFENIDNEISPDIFSANGSVLVGFESDGSLRVWHGESGKLLGEMKLRTTLSERLLSPKRVVTSHCVNATGTMALCGFESGLVIVYDLKTLKVRDQFRPHPKPVTFVGFGSEDRTIITGSDDNSMGVWNAETLKPIHRLSHDRPLKLLRLSPDGSRLITGETADDGNWRMFEVGGTVGTLQLWDLVQGRILATMPNRVAWSNAIDFTSDGARFVTIESAPADWIIDVRDSKDGTALERIQGHEDEIIGVGFDPVVGNRLVSWSNDMTAKIWYVGPDNPEIIRAEGIRDIAESADGKSVAGVSLDGMVRIWDLPTGALRKAWVGHKGTTRAIAFGRDGSHIITGGDDGKLIEWDIEHLDTPRTIMSSGKGFTYVETSRDARWTTAIVEDGTASLMDNESGKIVSFAVDLGKDVTSIVFSGNGNRLAYGLSDGTVKILETATTKFIAEVPSQRDREEQKKSRESAVALNHDGTRLAANLKSGRTITLWDIASEKEIRTFQGHRRDVTGIRFNASGTRLFSISADTSMKVWDVDSTSELVSLRGHSDAILAISANGDESRIMTAAADNTIRIWDSRLGHESVPIQDDAGAIESFVMNADRSRVLTSAGKRDDPIQTLWDIESRTALLRTRNAQLSRRGNIFLRHDRAERKVRIFDALSGNELARADVDGSVVLSDDGSQFWCAPPDGSVVVFNSRTCDRVATFSGNASPLGEVVFSRDGRFCAGLSGRDQIQLWDVKNLSEIDRFAPAEDDDFIGSMAFDDEAKRFYARMGRSDLVYDIPGRERKDRELTIAERFNVFSEREALVRGWIRKGTLWLEKENPRYSQWKDDAVYRSHWKPTWHAKDATRFERDQRWFAAAFHLKQLLKIKPTRQAVKDDKFTTDEELWADYQGRLEIAEANWKKECADQLKARLPEKPQE